MIRQSRTAARLSCNRASTLRSALLLPRAVGAVLLADTVNNSVGLGDTVSLEFEDAAVAALFMAGAGRRAATISHEHRHSTDRDTFP